LDCPACRGALVVLEIRSVEVDHCPSCGGVWLDGGELELLLEGAANKHDLMTSLTRDVEGREKSIRCPICSKKLDKVKYGVDEKVLLDMCPRNDGLWFDRGELLDVIEMGNFPKSHRVYELMSDIFGKSPR
jgi:Zn-finger nucleic acid-binding protein